MQASARVIWVRLGLRREFSSWQRALDFVRLLLPSVGRRFGEELLLLGKRLEQEERQRK